MQDIITYGLFTIGFVLLIKGADWLVSGASAIAKKFNISDFVIGLTIVSMGTSMPELIVNIMASFSGSSELALGNIIGSNISNIFLILGVSAIIYPLSIQRSVVKVEIPYSILAIVLLGFLANANFISHNLAPTITRFDGILLLTFFMLFVIYVIRTSKDASSPTLIEGPEDTDMKLLKSVVLIILGCLGLFLGGKWVVDGAEKIAFELGMSESLIGLTVVAIGTSLPELVTSAVAAYKRKTDIAVANVLGSNIFNILWVLGLSSVISPLAYDLALNMDLLILIGGSILLMSTVVIGKKNAMGRTEGILSVLFYATYVLYLIQRG